MEMSDNTATSSPAPTSTARRSGRVTKAPEKFTPDAPPASKRKRAADHDDEDGENESPDEVEDGEDEEAGSEDDADDSAVDEPKRASRKRASSHPVKSRKPAAKKPKTNGEAPSTLNHAARLPSRPKKAVRIDIGRRDDHSLYGM